MNPAIRIAADVIRAGGVIAYPTEAVWGLGCDPANESAVRYLLAIKRRPVEKGLILVASGERQLGALWEGLTPAQRETLRETWPGPVTWLVPHAGSVPHWIRGDHDTVAVRISAHPVVRSLCDAWGGMLVSTSANRAGMAPAREGFQVRRHFGSELDYIVPGRVGGATRPSTIRDLRSGKQLRD